MTGLDGLAWLNVFGLLLLWAIYWIVDQLRDTPGYERGLHHGTVAVAVSFVVADAKQWLPEQPSLLLQALAVLLLSMTAWELLAGLFVLAVASPVGDDVEAVGERAIRVEGQFLVEDLRPPSPQDREHRDEEGYLDLDAGTPHSAENRERLAGAIGELMGPRSTAAGRLRALGTLMAADSDEPEDDSSDLPYLLVGFALLAGVLGPPCWIALRLLG